jgi:hypothetical protein
MSEGDKVWLASFHMNVVTRQWYYMLEHDYSNISAISWPLFKALCQQHFEPPLANNHLFDLVHLQILLPHSSLPLPMFLAP